jgi:hypothetical protein
MNCEEAGELANMFSKIANVSLVLAAALTLAAADARSADDAKYPDWSGQWRRVPDGGVPRYDPSKPLRKQEAPLTAEYQALHEASIKEQEAGGHGLDEAYKCMPQGMPRQMSGVFPFEFVISPKLTYVLFEYMVLQTRRIYTDGRDFPKDEDSTFAGYSIGKWIDADGDGRYEVLEIETRNLRGPRTWDQSGMPMHADNETVIKERIYLDKGDRNILHDEMTTFDHSLTRPWSVMKNYRRVDKVTWTENNCVEGNQHVTIGKENYLLSADGYLMPTRKGQQPPDPRYFNQAKK